MMVSVTAATKIPGLQLTGIGGGIIIHAINADPFHGNGH